jgi:hypothetical protein
MRKDARAPYFPALLQNPTILGWARRRVAR